MKVTDNNCRFCHRDHLQILYPPSTKSQLAEISLFACSNCGFGLHETIVKCPNCGIIYSREDLSQEKIVDFYEDSEDALYLSEQKAREKTFGHYLSKLNRIVPGKGNLLDVGTNTGLFVKLAKENGWKAQGLEPNKEAVNFAKKQYRLELIHKPFDRSSLGTSRYDVITMWDVIEHFVDPVDQMKNVCHYLAEGGVFAFSTVDPESLSAKLMGSRWPWYMPMHRVFLSRFSAKRYLHEAGFKRVIFTSHWRYLSAGYLFPRLALAIGGLKSFNVVDSLVKAAGLQKLIVPYYANDLYDCYAFK